MAAACAANLAMSVDSEKPRRMSLKKRFAVWITRAVYVSVIMAVLDGWSGHYFGRGVFSVTTGGLKDGGTTTSIGPGYCMVYWRSMDGSAYGPEIWFWFAPIVVDAAHGGLKLRWLGT
jgi:hypothetical protein